MNLVIWNCNSLQEKLCALLMRKLPADTVTCFVTNDRNALNDYGNPPTLSVGALKLLVKNSFVDKIIILADDTDAAQYREILRQFFAMGVDWWRILFYAEFKWFEEMLSDKENYSFNDLIDLSKEKVPMMYSLEYEIVERCNLNCKRCNHFSNIFNDGKITDYETFCKDIDFVRQNVYNIKHFKLLGGEPLMHPDLARFIEYSRQSFPNSPISIITNGLLVLKMSDELINTIKKCNVTIEISLYPPLRENFHQFIGFLMFCGIQHKIFRYGDEFGSFLNLNGDSNQKWAMMQCYAQVCPAIKNGKIFRCTTVMNVDVFNRKYNTNLPPSYLNINELPQNGVGEILANYLTDPIEMCRFCDKFKNFPWEQTKNDAKMEDWVSRN